MPILADGNMSNDGRSDAAGESGCVGHNSAGDTQDGDSPIECRNQVVASPMMYCPS